MKTLRAAAVDIDGVLVADTFSPAIKVLVERYGGSYDREIERNVFSQNRHKAARYLIERLRLSMAEDEFLTLYFQIRDQWIADHGGGLNPGAESFLNVLSGAGLRLVCYGGLPHAYFERELGSLAARFETYVCTNDFRPGVKEIVHSTLQLAPQQVLFFDDVSRVAEAARDVGSPLVGMPAPFSWGHQRKDMEQLGVPFVIGSPTELTAGLLAQIDDRNLAGYWGYP